MALVYPLAPVPFLVSLKDLASSSIMMIGRPAVRRIMSARTAASPDTVGGSSHKCRFECFGSSSK